MCSSDLLETLIALLESNPEAVFAYAQSMMIDVKGKHLGLPLEWTNDLSTQRWLQAYVAPGRQELETALIHKNTIPNVSAVLFRNQPDLATLIDVDARLCGDWMTYVHLCRLGSVVFTPNPLNYWRQDSSNVRTRPSGVLEWQEGQAVVRAAAGLLGYEHQACEEAVARFLLRCKDWGLTLENAVEP